MAIVAITGRASAAPEERQAINTIVRELVDAGHTVRAGAGRSGIDAAVRQGTGAPAPALDDERNDARPPLAYSLGEGHDGAATRLLLGPSGDRPANLLLVVGDYVDGTVAGHPRAAYELARRLGISTKVDAASRHPQLNDLRQALTFADRHGFPEPPRASRLALGASIDQRLNRPPTAIVALPIDQLPIGHHGALLYVGPWPASTLHAVAPEAHVLSQPYHDAELAGYARLAIERGGLTVLGHSHPEGRIGEEHVVADRIARLARELSQGEITTNAPRGATITDTRNPLVALRERMDALHRNDEPSPQFVIDNHERPGTVVDRIGTLAAIALDDQRIQLRDFHTAAPEPGTQLDAQESDLSLESDLER